MKHALFFIFCLAIPSISFGDERVTTLAEGDPAPFDGTLFNTEAAVRIIVDLENAEEACQIELTRELSLQAAEYDLRISNLEASLSTCNSVCEERLEIYKNQSQYFQDQLLDQRKLRPAWAFVGGIILGTGITVGTTYAISQIVN